MLQVTTHVGSEQWGVTASSIIDRYPVQVAVFTRFKVQTFKTGVNKYGLTELFRDLTNIANLPTLWQIGA